MEQSLSIRAWVGIALLGMTILGGLMVGYLNVRRARGRRERRFVLRACLATWALVVCFLAAALYTDEPYNYISAAGFVLLVPALVYRWSVQHQLIRRLDGRDAAPPPAV